MPDDKTKLELKKLELEIRELARPILRRPAFLGAFVPLMLAIVALASTTLTGFFDERMAALRDQRRQLEVEIKNKSAEIENKEEELMYLEDQMRDYADQVKISADERKIGRLLYEIRNFHQECESKHPIQNDTTAIQKLRTRRDFYECLIVKLEYKVNGEQGPARDR